VDLNGERYQGQQRITVNAGLETIPVFMREGSNAAALLSAV
jgi:alpha-D-xyloside xylohydrolase